MSIVLTRATKQAARYTDAGGRERCSGCRFFMPQGTCGRIIGPVSPRGWCKYYSQEAVQRWQPQGAQGIGGIGPALDLSFMSGTLDPRITFTRASTATYTSATGVVQAAGVNAPRWDYDPATFASRGLLIEEPRTNVFLQSADASNAVWTKASNFVNPTVTANQSVAPDGTLVAASVVYPAVPSGGFLSALQQGWAVGAASYSFSVWLKGAVGGEQLYLMFTDGVATYRATTLVTLTTVWQRFTAIGTTTATAWYVQIGTDTRDAGQSAKPAMTIYVWGAQMEQGAFPTSYIPTTTVAVTRSADFCGILPASMGWFVSPGGSWMAEFIMANPTVSSQRIIFIPPGGGSITPLFVNAGYTIAQYDSTGIPATANSFSANTVVRAASNWVATTGRLCLNGGTVASGLMTVGYAAAVTSGLGLMSATGGGVENTTGYLRRVRYWPRVLSNAELQSVTT